MDGQVKARYQVRVSRQDDWWLARVLAASDGADSAPLNALTQARSLARIEPMARDLIATIIDADERTFDVELEYLLPDDASELVCQAHGARAWLDEAQDLWQERSTIAVRQLADRVTPSGRPRRCWASPISAWIRSSEVMPICDTATSWCSRARATRVPMATFWPKTRLISRRF
jgi:hypothetical protein